MFVTLRGLFCKNFENPLNNDSFNFVTSKIFVEKLLLNRMYFFLNLWLALCFFVFLALDLLFKTLILTFIFIYLMEGNFLSSIVMHFFFKNINFCRFRNFVFIWIILCFIPSLLKAVIYIGIVYKNYYFTCYTNEVKTFWFDYLREKVWKVQ